MNTKTFLSLAQCCPEVTGWTIKEWNSFKLVHPAIYIRNNGSLDMYNPSSGAKFGSDAYGYGWNLDMRRDMVVMYLEIGSSISYDYYYFSL